MTRITALTDPTRLPNPSQDQTTFDANFVYYFENLLLRAQQENAMAEEIEVALASFNSALAGNAYAIPYKVDLNSTADADPGAGKLRFNHATPSLATALRLNLVGFDTADYRKSIDSFDASTSVIKGTIRIVKLGDSRKFLAYNVTARATPTGYRNITVVPVDYSAASPFIHDEQVLLFFQRTGDKGDKGDVGPMGTVTYARFTQQYASGTAGPSGNSGVNVRPLNTVDSNNIPGATLANSTVTLAQAGTYEFRAHVLGGGPSRRAHLQNITDGVTVVFGTSAYSYGGVTLNIDSFMSGRFTISSSKNFQLQDFFNSTGTQGYATGLPGGGVEVYATLEIWKVA